MKNKIFILLFFYTSIFFSQNEKTALSWFDNVIGQKNVDINFGVVYEEKYRSLKEDYHFFINNEFNDATINYNNQFYYNVPVKYDLLNQELIVKIPSPKGGDPIILQKEKIDSFIIFNKFFENLSDYGFHEKLYAHNDFILYKKYFNTKTENFINDKIFYKFNVEQNYLLFYNGKFYSLNSKRDFREIFSDDKKTIRSYFSKNRKNQNTDQFMIELLETLVLKK